MLKDLFRPVLSDKTILKMNKKDILIEGDLSPTQIQPNSVDLTLDTTITTLNYQDGDVINPTDKIKYNTVDLKDSPAIIKNGHYFYILEPGEFVLMASKEILNIPNGIIAFVAGRSSIARLGIQVEQAGLIDAGFRGTITFEICNQTKHPIILYPGMRIAQVYFIKAQYALNAYATGNKISKYQSQGIATGSKIDNDPELSNIKSKK